MLYKNKFIGIFTAELTFLKKDKEIQLSYSMLCW